MSPEFQEQNATCFDFLAEAFKLPSRAPAWKWCEENITLDHTSPFQGKYRTDFTPMIRPVMNACQRTAIKKVVILCSAQSAKTQTIMNIVAWVIYNDPGEMFWVMASADSAKEFAKTRLLPLLERVECLKPLLPTNRTEKNIMLIMFATMNMMLRGSNSKSKLQSTPVRWTILDEVRNYEKGALELVEKRSRAWWNAKTIMISTPGAKNDAIHTAFLEGNQIFFHFNCPHCAHSQPFRFGRKPSVMFPTGRECGGLIWDTNDETKPKGVWNFKKLAATIRYQCENPECKHEFREHERFTLIKTLHEHERNTTGELGIVSFYWNALYIPWIKWEVSVIEFLKADMALRRGNIEPLKGFMNETLGEPWEEHGERPRDSELRRQCGANYGEPYDRGQLWPGILGTDFVFILTADVQGGQGGYIKWLLRQWRPNGDSRLVDYGTCLDFDDLHEIAEKFGVPPGCVFLDSGFRAAQVYGACLQWGWGCLKGDDRESFIIQFQGRAHRYPLKESWVDPSLGKKDQGRQQMPLIHWSNPSYKDRLLLHIFLGRGPVFQLPDDVGQDYLQEITAAERRAEQNERGIITHHWHKTGVDDWLDCELMQQVVADAGGITTAGDLPEISSVALEK